MLRDPESVRSARRRLLGHLVRTPLIGGLGLAGAGGPTLRVKPECLQTGRSIAFRAAMNAFSRSLGSWKGVVVGGRPRDAFAAASAAAIQRIPCTVVTSAGAVDWGRLDARVVEVERSVIAERAASVAAEQADVLYDARSVDAQDGIATVGLELADDLSTEVELVVCPEVHRGALLAGLAAGGRTIEVLGTRPDRMEPGALRAAQAGLRVGAGLLCDGVGAAAIAAACADPRPACAVVCS